MEQTKTTKKKKLNQLNLNYPKRIIIIKNEIQVLSPVEILGVGKVFQINILKSMLKREKVKKLTLKLE